LAALIASWSLECPFVRLDIILDEESLRPTGGTSRALEMAGGAGKCCMLGSEAEPLVLLVTTLLLRDLVLLGDEERGGRAVSTILACLFRSFRSVWDDNVTLEEDAEVRLSLRTGSFGALVLTFKGTGTV